MPRASLGGPRRAGSPRRGARAVFDTLGEGLIIWSQDGQILDCNRTAAEILGRPCSELRAMDFDDVMRTAVLEMAPVHEDGRPLVPSELPAIQASRQGRPALGRVVGITRPDATHVWLEIDVRPVEDEFEGKLLVTSFRDITERKTAQDRSRARGDRGIVERRARTVGGAVPIARAAIVRRRVRARRRRRDHLREPGGRPLRVHPCRARGRGQPRAHPPRRRRPPPGPRLRHRRPSRQCHRRVAVPAGGRVVLLGGAGAHRRPRRPRSRRLGRQPARHHRSTARPRPSGSKPRSATARASNGRRSDSACSISSRRSPP